MASALSDIRVLDLTDESGVFATRLLADFGADVIRVEPPDGGRVRNHAPFLDSSRNAEKSYYHLFNNINKRSVVIDTESTGGREQLKHLARTVDVLVETGRPGELNKLGLGYDEVSATNPGIVYVSISPFGRSGPWSDRHGSDLIAAATSGLLYTSGSPEDPPMHGNADPAFKMASLQAVAGALIALRGRGDNGRGAHVDVSVQEGALMMMVQALNPNIYTRDGKDPRRHGLHAPLFQCKDGRWVGVRVRPDRFQKFLDWAAKEGVSTALDGSSLSRLQEGGADINTSADVMDTLEAVASRLTVEQVLEIAWALDLIALPVGRFEEMALQDHFVQTRQFQSIDFPRVGCTLGVTRSPFDGMAGGVEMNPAPGLGEHTDEVLESLSQTDSSASSRVKPFDATAPLAGLRILDFTWVLAGPFGSRILANFGAEVIRIESHSRPDSTRMNIPKGATNLSTGYLFNDANAGKQSLTLDVSKPEAKELIRRLVAKVDVVTNNFRPGAMERMGLGYESLRQIKPDIISVSLPGCGSKGPWAEKGTLGGVLVAASGLNDISGFPGRPPFGVATAYPDFSSPYLLASAVIAAVHERDRTGLGQAVEINQLSATIGLLGPEWMQFQAEGSIGRNANRSHNHCPHGVYPTTGDDAWIAIAVGTDDQWRTLARTMGFDGLADDSRFATFENRKANEDDLDAVIREWTCNQDKWAAADALQQRGVAAAPVESLAELVDRDPQLAHRDHYQRLRQPTEPEVELTIDAEAIHFEGFDRVLQRAPAMGEHNEYALRELLGLSEEEFDALVVAGVID